MSLLSFKHHAINLFTGLSLTLSISVEAQTKSHVAAHKWAASSGPHGPLGGAGNRLSELIDLPDLPKYTGRVRVLSVIDYPPDQAVKSRRVLMRFAVREPKESVISWYKDALTSYSWKIDPLQAENEEITAKKGSKMCVVRVEPDKGPWFASVVNINYHTE